MKLLPVQRAAKLPINGPQTQWLIEELWGEHAVGILGGEPKCCKSFLALDMALSVASGTPCLRHFPVCRQGTVLFFPAEDSLAVVRRRLQGLCAAAHLDLQSLPLEVITAPAVRLDLPGDRQLLRNTVDNIKPVLLILDPLIRLHRLDENDASQIAGLLSFLRELQRNFHLSIVVVHHARKGANSARPGQALRGSSELHGWGDSNLYMRRRGAQLTLSTEHRAAPSRDHIPLELLQQDDALSLELSSIDHHNPDNDNTNPPPARSKTTPAQRICNALAQLDHPIDLRKLRQLCAMRTASFCSALNQLCQQGVVHKQSQGYRLAPNPPRNQSVSPPLPIEMQVNGNGKHP